MPIIATLNQHFLPLQKAAVQHKSSVIGLFLLLETCLMGGLVGIFFSFQLRLISLGSMVMLGYKMGIVALIFYCLTLLPGIFSRLQCLTVFGATLMLFRRHLGITTFLLVLSHFCLATLFPTLLGPIPLFFDMARFFGLTALALLFPMWLTSNDLSERWLGRKWKLLHRVTYLVLLLIFFHLALFMKSWAVLPFVFLLLEIASWVAFFARQKFFGTAPKLL